MKTLKNEILDSERALYAERGIRVENCTFDGPADGESALKECKNIEVISSYFNLRYPFWHDDKVTIISCELTEACRAALWYTSDVNIYNSKLHGIKALRECSRIGIYDTDIASAEFGWFSDSIMIERTSIEGEYLFLRSSDITLRSVKQKGKYSFQYVSGALIEDSCLDTKDAFWHAKNVTVRNSELRGEYLGWYSEGLTLENCRIVGTQPLCYAKNLKLVDCEMINCDLSFERSEVEATLTAHIDSIKNPVKGYVKAPSCGEIIRDFGNDFADIIIG